MSNKTEHEAAIAMELGCHCESFTAKPDGGECCYDAQSPKESCSKKMVVFPTK